MQRAGWWRRLALCAAVVLLTGSWAGGQEKAKVKEKAKEPEKKEILTPQQKAQQKAKEEAFKKQVNEAIDRGLKHLRSIQRADGTWPSGFIGATALAGLALLEGGAAPNDPAVIKAAAAVRQGVIRNTHNYSIALSLLFLDRLGDPQDVPFIEALAIRLLAAQNTQIGNWSYFAPNPDAAELQYLEAVLQNRKEPAGPQGFIAPKDRKRRPLAEVPQGVLQRIASIYNTPRGDQGVAGDNSNSQFALIALWAARRHGIPIEIALGLAERRLRQTQFKNGGWAYNPPLQAGLAMPGMADQAPSSQMTCCGLIGLALAYGVDTQKANKRDMTKDVAIRAGLLALGGVVGEPTGDVTKAYKLASGHGNRGYYFLWVLERTAVMYDLKTLGDRDWYTWGAEVLLNSQGADGGWAGEYAEAGCDTCFALLFLKRANLASDLTTRIKGKQKDPGRPKLVEPIFDPSGGTKKPRGKQGAAPGGAGRQSAAPALVHPLLREAYVPAPREPLPGTAPRAVRTFDPRRLCLDGIAVPGPVS